MCGKQKIVHCVMMMAYVSVNGTMYEFHTVSNEIVNIKSHTIDRTHYQHARSAS